MISTQDYLNYVNGSIEISPVNSEEEYQAAKSICDAMKAHGLEASIEEFEVPALTNILPAVISVLMLVGIVFTGLSKIPLVIIGFVLAVIPAVVSALKHIGYNLSFAFGPKANSQNVYCFHPAEGPKVVKGNRKIVVVAHYDTPKVNFLYESLGQYLSLLTKVAHLCEIGVAVCALLQIAKFLPEAFRLVVWILGMLLCLPSLVLAAGAFAENFAGCSLGSNDNKASVAALFSVLGRISPATVLPEIPERPSVEEETEEAKTDESAEEHDGGPEDTSSFDDQPGVTDEPEETGTIGQDTDTLRKGEGISVDGEDTYNPDDPDATQFVSPEELGLFDPAEDSADKTASKTADGPQHFAEDANADADADADTDADAPDKAGETSSVRKPSLFDLPDPDGLNGDPFATSVDLGTHDWKGGAARRGGLRFVDEDPVKEDAGSEAGSVVEPADNSADKTAVNLDNASIDKSDTNMEAEDVLSEGAQPVETAADGETDRYTGGPDAEIQEDNELREALLSLSNEDLVSHDIHFVALGASSLGHGGIKDFMARHHSDIRGSFVINLDCVGAGTLSVLSREGKILTRPSDRRIARLLKEVAADLHIPLETRVYDWNTTDASPVLHERMRGATIMGVDEHGLPAFSHTAGDEPDVVSARQVDDVAVLVTELIRRS